VNAVFTLYERLAGNDMPVKCMVTKSPSFRDGVHITVADKDMLVTISLDLSRETALSLYGQLQGQLKIETMPKRRRRA
jgi:hypothetical protein